MDRSQMLHRSIRWTPGQWAAVEAAAPAFGLDASGFVRFAVSRQIATLPPDVGAVWSGAAPVPADPGPRELPLRLRAPNPFSPFMIDPRSIDSHQLLLAIVQSFLRPADVPPPAPWRTEAAALLARATVLLLDPPPGPLEALPPVPSAPLDPPAIMSWVRAAVGMPPSPARTASWRLALLAATRERYAIASSPVLDTSGGDPDPATVAALGPCLESALLHACDPAWTFDPYAAPMLALPHDPRCHYFSSLARLLVSACVPSAYAALSTSFLALCLEQAPSWVPAQPSIAALRAFLARHPGPAGSAFSLLPWDRESMSVPGKLALESYLGAVSLVRTQCDTQIREVLALDGAPA